MHLPYFSVGLWRYFRHISRTMKSGFAFRPASPSPIVIFIRPMLWWTTMVFPIFYFSSIFYVIAEWINTKYNVEHGYLLLSNIPRWRIPASSSIPAINTVALFWLAILCIDHSWFGAFAAIWCGFWITFIYLFIIFWSWIIVTKAPFKFERDENCELIKNQ